MGCSTSSVVEEDSQLHTPLPSQPEACYPVPFGHVPYTPALPGAMGPLWDFPIEWWYYAGWATNLTGSKKFTILLETVRLNQNTTETEAGLLYGIGSTTTGSKKHQFTTQWSGGVGHFPTPTSSSWSTTVQAISPTKAEMSSKLIFGKLCRPGATYQLDMKHTFNNVTASFLLTDTFGMILEGASGVYKHPDSFEFAMPSLSIQKGSTITINGITSELGGGNLWLDRQTVRTSENVQNFVPKLQPKSGDYKSLYIGNWLALTMNDNTRYMMAFFWPPKPDQWIVGTELDLPVYPTKKIGLEYPSMRGWDGISPIQGVNVLDSSEFDLNILNPKDPINSPHWTSRISDNTYSSAWRVRIREKLYKMSVLVAGSEVRYHTQAFFEGAATICNENGTEAGVAFVEQMGYN